MIVTSPKPHAKSPMQPTNGDLMTLHELRKDLKALGYRLTTKTFKSLGTTHATVTHEATGYDQYSVGFYTTGHVEAMAAWCAYRDQNREALKTLNLIGLLK